MMGEQVVAQEALFYGFSLERHVPADHLLRRLDRFVNLSAIRAELRPYYSDMGRPSIDPELMIRMLIVGYCMGLRSERRLCDEVHLNLAYRWFCRLGLDGDVPDHSTFSKNRHGRFRDCDLFRRLFERTVERCMAEGLVGGDGFAVDASLIRAEANRQRFHPGEEGLPPDLSSRAVNEYLAVLDDAAFGAASQVMPARVSPADPAARYPSAHGGQAQFCYATNYLVDVKHAVIVDVEPSTAVRQAEVTAAKRMIERVHDGLGLWPRKLIGDTGYGSADMLAWLVNERGIEPHIPVLDKANRADGTFSRSDFAYDARRDVYTCPAGKLLTRYQRRHGCRTDQPHADGFFRYRASKADCSSCALKPRCCPTADARKVPRSMHEGARDLARAVAREDEWLTSRRERKKVEMLFAHLKRILKLDRLRLRGPNGAKDEFHLAAAAQNLRKLAKLIPPAAQPVPA
ncbi:MAG: Mobile element protein [uncultured Sphingomonadaceae bacterium]|uniref:Mobile element protein n=1 Tax=uncultured Sphingomonadaceae bacterium TaxID=169976 RepID=A0A6J4RWG7_9SPHN|nr:MAG: Mobile element protein [uncultured Sphingomonadaceae bacterium]